MKNSNYLKALQQQNTDHYVPVWFLRQAGRYLPEYKAVRARFSDFFEMIKTPQVCCELTLQPLRRFHLDAAITFSDILTIPEALGNEISFIEGRGPVFKEAIKNGDNPKLDIGGFENLDYVFEATQLIKSKIDVPLIGFAGSPWTIFIYSFYGESPKDFNLVREFIAKSPEQTKEILATYTDVTIKYLKGQIDAGADCLQVFDSWGGILDQGYEEFSLKFINDIRAAIDPEIPLILYARGMKIMLHLNATEINCFNLDQNENIDEYINKPITIQGNIDPNDFNQDEEKVLALAENIYEKYSQCGNYVCNVGSGITPDIDPNKVGLFLQRLRVLNSK